MVQQWNITQQSVSSQVQNLDLSVKFRNADNLLLASRPQEAKALLIEINNVDPNFPNLKDKINQADSLIATDATYAEATKMLATGDYSGALVKFEEISAEAPNYKDVSIQISNIKKSFLLAESFDKAEQAYADGDWQVAIDWYENVRDSDAEFRIDYVEQRLYNSYIQAAEGALSKPSNSMEDLTLAENYFHKALALRPRDAKIIAQMARARNDIEERLVISYLKAGQAALIGKADSVAALQEAQKYFNQALVLRPGDVAVYSQLELAQTYLQAINNYQKGVYTDVIKSLETIYKEDKGYADGTARQTLYEAYMARGNQEVAAGEYEDALLDFQRSALIAQQSPDSILRLFEAQLKIADVSGLLGSYKEAVQIYQAAIDLGGLREMADQKKSKLSQELQKADALAETFYYRGAYQAYSSALHDIGDLYNITEITVSSGDYLTMLARRYNSTVDAILLANNLQDASDLSPNSKLIIPNLQRTISKTP